MVSEKIEKLLKLLEQEVAPEIPSPLPQPPPESEVPLAEPSPDPCSDFSDLKKANEYFADADKYSQENRIPLAIHHIGDGLKAVADALMKMGKGDVAAKLQDLSKGMEYGGKEREELPPPESDPGEPTPKTETTACKCSNCVSSTRDQRDKCWGKGFDGAPMTGTPKCKNTSEFHRPGQGFYCYDCWRDLVKSEMPGGILTDPSDHDHNGNGR